LRGRDHTFLVLSHEMLEAFPWRKHVWRVHPHYISHRPACLA
jgi:hypothetical protein